MKKFNWKKFLMVLMVCIAIACVCCILWVVFLPKPISSTYYLDNGEEIFMGNSTSTIAASSIVIPAIAFLVSTTAAVVCGLKIKAEKLKSKN